MNAPTKVNTVTELESNCPDCNDDSLCVLFEHEDKDGEIVEKYSVYCSHEHRCGFDSGMRTLDPVNTDAFASKDEAYTYARELALTTVQRQLEDGLF